MSVVLLGWITLRWSSKELGEKKKSLSNLARMAIGEADWFREREDIFIS